MSTEPLDPVALQLIAELESAEQWSASYQPEGTLDLASAEERGSRQGYVDGLRRAVDVLVASTRTNIIYPPS